MPSPHAVAELFRLANRRKPGSEAFAAVASVGQTIYNVFRKTLEAAF